MGRLPGPLAAAGLSYCTVNKGKSKHQRALLLLLLQQCPGGLALLATPFLSALVLVLRCLQGSS